MFISDAQCVPQRQPSLWYWCLQMSSMIIMLSSISPQWQWSTCVRSGAWPSTISSSGQTDAPLSIKAKGPSLISPMPSATLIPPFGSRHGKGPSDGEAAVVKNHTMTAIKAGAAVVSSAEDMYSYLIGSVLNKQPPEEGCTHSLRTFLWIPDGAIQRDRPGRKLETVKGTRSFHTVKCVQQGAIMTRHLACACDACLTGVGSCLNRDLVGPWTCHALSQPGRHQQPHQAIPAAKRSHVH